VFIKAFFYTLLNLLIIPGIAFTTAGKLIPNLDSLFSIVVNKIYDIPHLLGRLYIQNSGYFFVMLVIQNGTILSIYNLLRLSDIFTNSFSSFVAYYKRYFSNIGKYWHRRAGDIFQYGYFYAIYLTVYSIGLIFSSTVPFICLATLYFLYSRHVVDFINLLTVHGSEIESAGNLINYVFKFNILPILFYHISMISFFLIQGKYYLAIIVIVLSVLCFIFWTFKFNTKYIIDVYALHESLKVYELHNHEVSENELNKWR
jgi:hypothetical protein